MLADAHGVSDGVDEDEFAVFCRSAKPAVASDERRQPLVPAVPVQGSGAVCIATLATVVGGIGGRCTAIGLAAFDGVRRPLTQLPKTLAARDGGIAA